MDGPRKYYAKWNKSETNTVWYQLYVESKKQKQNQKRKGRGGGIGEKDEGEYSH